MEKRLLKKANIVFACSDYLFKKQKKLNKNTHLIPHGVDYESFSKALKDIKIPEDIKGIKKPIIGFFGLIHKWVDFDLIEEIAEKNKDWNIVIIGKALVNVSRLKKHSNIYFLGQKKYEELPAYCKAFDVAIIPYKINNFAASVNPSKLREYLASGLPVVSTDLPEARKIKEVKIAKNNGEFIKNIEKSLDIKNKGKLMISKKMEKEDWKYKVEKISKLLDN